MSIANVVALADLLGAVVAFFTVIGLELWFPRRVVIGGRREIDFTSGWGGNAATRAERAIFRSGLSVGATLYSVAAVMHVATATSAAEQVLAGGAALASTALLGVAWIPHDGGRWRGPAHAIAALTFFGSSIAIAITALILTPSLTLGLLLLLLVPGLLAITLESLRAIAAGVGLSFYFRATGRNARLRRVETPLSLAIAGIWFVLAWPVG